MNWIDSAYAGKQKLWKVFWFGWGAPLVPLVIAVNIYRELATRIPSWVGIVLILLLLLYYAWLSIALWRCAPNASSGFGKFLGRAFAVLLALLTLAGALRFLRGAP